MDVVLSFGSFDPAGGLTAAPPRTGALARVPGLQPCKTLRESPGVSDAHRASLRPGLEGMAGNPGA